MDAFETYLHNGVTVELYYDEDATSPRENDNAGTIISFTREFAGDEYLSLEEDGLMVECPICGESGYNGRAVLIRRAGNSGRLVGAGSIASMESEYDRDDDKNNLSLINTECSTCEGGGQVNATVIEYLRDLKDAAVVIPLYFADYRSGGSKLDETDSNPNAAIYITTEKIETEFGSTTKSEIIEKAQACLKSEVSEMNSYLEGEVYGYIIKDASGEDLPAKLADSCWGFIGDVSYVKEEAEEAAEYIAKALAEETAEAAEMAARDIVTVDA